MWLLSTLLALSLCKSIAFHPSSKNSQFFLDSADVKQWDRLLPLGIFHGITTNPILLQKAGVPCTLKSLKNLATVALTEYNQPSFMLQTWGATEIMMVENGRRLASISDKIVVKVPLSPDGIYAAAKLKQNNIPICMTACYQSHQVFTSVGLSAEYVAPYLGRIIDSGRDGIQEVIKMQRIVDGLQSNTRVFVASLRDPSQLATLSAAGCNTFTFSPAIADSLLQEPMSISAAEDFERAVSDSL
jgi:transaldolase